MTRVVRLAPILALALATSARADAPTVTAIGDGGSVGVQVQNRSVHPLPIALGAAGDDGVAQVLPRYAEGGFVAQCIEGARGEAPALWATVDGQASAVEVPPIGFPDGAPILWIADQRTGRAALQAVVEAVIPGATVHHLEPAAVPSAFAGLRFARAILVSATDYARLAPERRRAVADAVSAGVTLIVATGEAGAAPDALAGLAPITLGDVGRPTGALADHLSRASARRRIVPGDGARATLVADGTPAVVEARRGLGTVRVLGVRFADLEPGAVADAALRPPPEPLGHVLRWLAQAPPPSESRASPFAAHVWILLSVLVGIVAITRRRPRLALMLAVPWWVVALALPPQWSATRVDGARVLYVPTPDGALAVGSVELTLTRGGPRTLPAALARVALEDARPGGACLVSGGGRAGWVVEGEPGAARRLTFFAVVDALPEGADKLGDLPEWPPGPLAGATLRRVQSGPVPIEGAPATLDAARVEPRPPAALTPTVLGQMGP